MELITLINVEGKNQFICKDAVLIKDAIVKFMNKTSNWNDWSITEDGDVRSNTLKTNIEWSTTTLPVI